MLNLEKPTNRPDKPTEEEVLRKFVKVLNPPTQMKRWQCSRLGLLESGRTVQVLHVLALAKYGDYDLNQWTPYWKDRNWRNETYDNIDLMTVGDAAPRKSMFPGVPSGSKEYWQLYRKARAERLRSYQKKYNRKRSEDRKTALEQSERALDAELNALLKIEPSKE